MRELLASLDWAEVIMTVWTVILLPVLTYAAGQLNQWAQSKRIDKYTAILQQNVTAAVKDVYQTIVADLKGTEGWTAQKQAEVKEIARQKAIQALSNIAYQTLRQANEDFEEYLNSLIETSLYDLKYGK